jgi:hypothetical protein
VLLYWLSSDVAAPLHNTINNHRASNFNLRATTRKSLRLHAHNYCLTIGHFSQYGAVSPALYQQLELKASPADQYVIGNVDVADLY